MDKLRSKKRYKTYRNKRIIHPEDTTVINRYELNNRTSKYMKKKLTELKGVIDICTITVEDLNILLQVMDRTSGQKINKEIGDLNNTIKLFRLNRHIEYTT